MSDLTPEKATALRKPFPKESIGKLPKPYSATSQKANCPECHGYHGMPAAHLDYVGHAATTERLLTVDPEWYWEPMATDPLGLPVLDSGGNLWIRLTVCGMTRIGVGDGKSAKEKIGDAIRNAAMRFGVALDLWAKEDLVEFAQSIGVATPAPTADATPDGPPAEQPATRKMSRTPKTDQAAAPKPISREQQVKMLACFTDLGIKDREARLEYCREVVKRDGITTSNDLTSAEAHKVIEALEADLSEPPLLGGEA